MNLRPLYRGLSVYGLTVFATVLAIAVSVWVIASLEYLLRIDDPAGIFLLLPPLTVFMFVVLFSVVARLHRWCSLRALTVAAASIFGVVLAFEIWLGWFGASLLFLALVLGPLLVAGIVGWGAGALVVKVRFRRLQPHG